MERFLRLPDSGKAVFVGDTHGDYDSSRIVIENFLGRKDYYVVFLGDYVDRGSNSRANIDYLLSLAENHGNLVLLAGNHEMFPLMECRPSDFWENLSEPDFSRYKEVLTALPLAVSGKGFMALHGALPDLEDIADINRIEDGDADWRSVLWGDFRDKPGERFKDFLGRPKFGRDYFERVMECFGKNVLIRSHDPLVSERLFDNRCLTIFTSSFYAKERKIAICDLSEEVQDIDDIDIISFDSI